MSKKQRQILKNFNIRLATPLANKIKELADAQSRTPTGMARVLLQEGVARYEKAKS